LRRYAELLAFAQTFNSFFSRFLGLVTEKLKYAFRFIIKLR